MNKTKLTYLTILGLAFLEPVCLKLKADLPPDWPGVTVTTYDSNHVAPGYVFLAVASVTPDVGTYMMVLQNDGAPVWYEKLPNEEILTVSPRPSVSASSRSTLSTRSADSFRDSPTS